MKQYNEKKVCFIICSNNDQYLKECTMYIDMLKIPDEYEIEVLVVRDAESMAAGYNEAMNSSDARYKVYLHQDTFIIEKDFIAKILKIFSEDSEIGMIGMVGAETLSKDGVMWHRERCGDFYRLSNEEAQMAQVEKIDEGIREVEAIDGFLMVTCQDIPWRSDLFDKWDFYDVSQCLEFQKAGYKIVVPAQNSAWTIHDCVTLSLWNYENERKKLLENYPEFFCKKKELRIIFFHSSRIQLIGLSMGFAELGHVVDEANMQVTLEDYVEEKEKIVGVLEMGHYDLAVTYDFSKSVSVACEEMGVKYLAWVYDSPLMELYTKEAQNECNYISVFDKKQKERLSGLGLKHLYYYPLAAEVGNFGVVVISKTDEKKYAADISFVGSLYDQGWFEKILAKADESIQKDAYRVASSTNCIWDGKENVFGKAERKTLDYMTAQEGAATWKNYKVEQDYFNEALLFTRKANEIERVTILNKLAEKYNVVLYTGSKEIKQLKNVKVRPRVDYLLEMPKIFHLSRINLNITSRSIESGIPQRIWDVMGVGGFMLTNYQPEIEEYFEIGKEIEVFHNLEELMEKADFYLKHEDKRMRIAMNGYQKVRDYHTYSKRLEQILEEVFGYRDE